MKKFTLEVLHERTGSWRPVIMATKRDFTQAHIAMRDMKARWPEAKYRLIEVSEKGARTVVAQTK